MGGLTRAWLGLVIVMTGWTVRADDAPRPPAAQNLAQPMTLLRENCLACHNPEKKKGKLDLTTHDAALHGGEDGPAFIAGKSGESRMINALASDADPHMPPKGQLTKDEISWLASWIDAGAAWDASFLTRPVSSATRPIELRPVPASYHPVLTIALSPDQKRLAAGRGDHILLFDLTQDAKPVALDLQTPRDVVQSLAWNPDGALLASGGFRTIRLWDGRSVEPTRTITGVIGRATALAFSADGHLLIAAEGEAASPGAIRTWALPAAEPCDTWVAHADSILALRASDDGKLLVTAGADRLVKIWDLPAHKELAKLEGHGGPVMAVALSADGTRLASAGADKELKIWNVKTSEQTAALTTHPGAVTDLAWTADGKNLLSACEDGSPRLSSPESKERAIRTFNNAPDVLYCAVMTRDGKTVYAGCHDGSVYAWEAASGNLLGKLGAMEPPAKKK